MGCEDDGWLHTSRFGSRHTYLLAKGVVCSDSRLTTECAERSGPRWARAAPFEREEIRESGLDKETLEPRLGWRTQND